MRFSLSTYIRGVMLSLAVLFNIQLSDGCHAATRLCDRPDSLVKNMVASSEMINVASEGWVLFRQLGESQSVTLL